MNLSFFLSLFCSPLFDEFNSRLKINRNGFVVIIIIVEALAFIEMLQLDCVYSFVVTDYVVEKEYKEPMMLNTQIVQQQ